MSEKLSILSGRNNQKTRKIKNYYFKGKFQNGKFIKCKKIIFRIKNILFNFTYILFFASIIFYLMSLKGCHLSFQECQNLSRTKFYVYLGIYVFISCLLFGLCLTLQIVLKLRRINYVIFLTSFIIIFIFTQGTDFASHGTYNCLSFIFLLPLIIGIFLYIYKIFYYCYHREIKKLFFIILITISIISLYNYKTRCNDYYDGLGKEKIINDPSNDSCEFQIPSRCGMKYFSGIFDFTLFFKICKGFNDNKDTFLKYLDKSFNNYDKFYYPRTEHWPPKNTYFNLANYVEKNITPEYNNNSSYINNDREISIIFKDGKGSVNINLKKNETLIKERRKIAELNPVKYDNVYILFFDAISRNHFQRKLKKSSKVIEQLLYSNNIKNEKYKNYNSFQFFKYHNFDGYTRGNNMPFIFGNGMYASTGISITKFFKEKGFITCATHNSCNKEIFDWEPDFYKDFEFSDWDHENLALFCDTNYEDKENKWTMSFGKTSVFRKCFYDKDSFEYNFEYIRQFLEAYKDERKFFKAMISDGHEMTMEVIKFIDDPLSKLLETILNNYANDKTAIIVMSDHGPHSPFIYDVLFYEEKDMELHMGVFFLILSGNDTLNIYDNLYYNQQKFLTTYDLHDTLLDMININKYKYPQMNNEKGQSIFNKINGKERTCDKYGQDLNTCYCKKYKN